ncbi:tRNA A64-2'-O-ribosylphosphate transferase [Pleosporales sp. CAS-2024a]
MDQPFSEADILFPHLTNTPSFSTTLSSLKRSALSIHNRLDSIVSDSEFVASVAECYHLPLVANERCGSWYIPPENKTEGVYFKSTDGHMGQWGFSLRRLNLQLLNVVEKHGGAVIVDSTRRGKSMPDALSKTIPIWCCVINRAIFGAEGEHAPLYTPPQAVSASEHSQISTKVDGFVQHFIDICKPQLPELRLKVQKPLRPIWITQQSPVPDSIPIFKEFHPIVLCTASRRVNGAEASEGGYVQGAADDHEAWSHGLTPPLFWKYKDLLMSTSEDDAPHVIAKLLQQESTAVTSLVGYTLIKPTTTLYISPSQDVKLAGVDVIIGCTPEAIPATVLKEAKVQHYLALKCQTGKLGSRHLRNELPLVPDFLSNMSSAPSTKILVCCPTGKDLSVGTALAILCLYADDGGNIDLANRRATTDMNKNLIKQRLSWITTSNPWLNPSRATLQSVNAMLLTKQDAQATRLRVRTRTPIPPPDTSSPPPSLADKIRPLSLPSLIFTTLSHSPRWSFHRTLTSTLPTHPSGTVTGTATFTPCALPPSFPPTLLYAEQGTFTTSSNLSFSARRKYVYQLVDGELVIRFFDDDNMAGRGEEGVGPNGEGVGGVFVEMGSMEEGRAGGGGGEGGGVMAAKNKEKHLCAEDLYGAGWRFGARMVGGSNSKEGGDKMWWEVRYDVQGPKKDYVSETRYERV